jgi:hypothetical protein
MWNGRQALWRTGYMLAVTAVLVAVFGAQSYDDPYITYRYAFNLAHGLGFVYNQAERVLSTTTPLFTLILATLSTVTTELPLVANLIGSLCLAGGALCLWEMARIGRRPAVGWVGLVMYPAFPLLITTLGSEMPLYLLLCLAAIMFYQRQQYSASAACAGLAVITRPDGLLLGAVLVGHALITRWPAIRTAGVHRLVSRVILQPIVIFLLIAGLWSGFALIYFGSSLPVTLAAKQAQGSMPVSQLFLPGILTIWQDYAPYITSWLALGLALLGISTLGKHDVVFRLVLAWAALQVIAYTLLGVTRYFWYYAPIVPAFVLAIGLGIVTLISLLHGVLSRMDVRWNYVLVAICVAGLASGVMQQDVLMRQNPNQRVLLYRAVGEWLRANTDPTATVATLEAGAIGYYSQRTLIDFAGLIQPEVARQLTASANYDDAALWALAKYLPDYIVLRPGSLPRLEAELVARTCPLMQSFKGQAFNYPGDIAIYHCRYPAIG